MAHVIFVLTAFDYVNISVMLPSILICGLASWLYNVRIGMLTLILTHPCHMLLMMHNLDDLQGWKIAVKPSDLVVGMPIQLCAVLFAGLIRRNYTKISTITDRMNQQILQRNEELKRISALVKLRSETDLTGMVEIFCTYFSRQQSDIQEISEMIRKELMLTLSPLASTALRLEMMAGTSSRDIIFRESLTDRSIAVSGIKHALEDMCSHISEMTGTFFKIEIEDRLNAASPDPGFTIYRIVHEAVTNAMRHGKARQITISLVEQGECAVLDVVNDGVPLADDPRPGLGMKLIEQRTAKLRGTLSLSSIDCGATRLRCTLPVESLFRAHSDEENKALPGAEQTLNSPA